MSAKISDDVTRADRRSSWVTAVMAAAAEAGQDCKGNAFSCFIYGTLENIPSPLICRG